MGEIFVKKNNAFERVVGDGNTVIVQGGGGGGGGVTIVFHARQNESTNSAHYMPYSSSANFPLDGTLESPSNPGFLINFRNLSKYFDVIDVNTNSLNTGQPFDSETGVFTAPVAGVYRFTASGTVGLNQAGEVTGNNSSSFWMWLRKNPTNANQIANFVNDRVGSVLFVARDDEHAAGSIDIHHPSHTWELELQANDRIVLCAAWFKGDQTENTTNPPQGYRVWVGDCSFSGSYVGGASVTPVGPQACFVKSDGTFTPSQENGFITKISGNALNPAATFTEVIDSLNEFDVASGTFTAKTKGVYSVNFTTNVLDGGVSICDVWMQKNSPFNGNIDNNYGGVLQNNTAGSASIGTTFNNMSKTWLVEMDVGDNLTWWVKITAFTGSGPPNQKLEEISISVHLLTSTQTIDPPLETPVAVYAHSTPRDGLDNRGFGNNVLYGQGIFRVRNGITVPAPAGAPSQATRTFTLNELVDSGGSFDVNTGVFTAPIGGLYSITMYAELQDGQAVYSTDSSNSPSISAYGTMWIRKTPAGQSALVAPTDPQDSLRHGQLVRVSSGIVDETMQMSGDWLVQMNEGDQITWYANPNGLVNTTAGNKLQSIALSANLITPTDRNIKMSRGSAPALYAHCSTLSYSTANGSHVPVDNATVTIFPVSAPNGPYISGTGGTKICNPRFASGFTLDELIDTSSAFDPETGIFVAPIKGVYSVSIGSSLLEGSDSTRENFWIQKAAFGDHSSLNNTGNITQNYGGAMTFTADGAIWTPWSRTWLVEMEAGDALAWYYKGGSATRVHSVTLSAHLLTSTETVFSDGNPDVLFAVYSVNPNESTVQTANQNAGAGLFVLPNANTDFVFKVKPYSTAGDTTIREEVDTTSSYDPSTGIFTSPISGWYEFDFLVEHQPNAGEGAVTSGTLIVWMEKNNNTGSPVVSIGSSQDTQASTNLIGNRAINNAYFNTPPTMTLKNVVYLSQGETVCVFGRGAPQTRIINWRFSGKRIPPVNSSSGIGAGTVYSDYSATENGWTRIAPGVIMQWGKETITNPGEGVDDRFVNMTFPKSFTSIPWNASVTAVLTDGESNINGQNYCGQAMNITATGMRVIANRVNAVAGSNPLYLHWQAIGPG